MILDASVLSYKPVETRSRRSMWGRVRRFFSRRPKPTGWPEGYFLSPGTQSLVRITVIPKADQNEVLEEKVARETPSTIISPTPISPSEIRQYVEKNYSRVIAEANRSAQSYRATIEQLAGELNKNNGLEAVRIATVARSTDAYIREKFEEAALTRGISGRKFAGSYGMSSAELYRILGKGKINELKEKRMDQILDEYRESYKSDPQIKVTDFCRKHNVSPSSFYRHAQKSGGVEALRSGEIPEQALQDNSYSERQVA